MKKHFASPAPHLVPACLAFLIFAHTASAATVYRQTFGFEGDIPGSGAWTDLSSVGWKVLSQLTDYSVDPANTTPIEGSAPDYYVGIRNFAGAPTTDGNIGTPLPSISTTHGVAMIFRADSQSYQTLLYADHFAINQSLYQVDTISWYSASTNGAPENSIRAALKINGLWYASDEVASAALAGNNMENFSSSAQEFSVSLNSASWYLLDAEVGGDFGVAGTMITLPTSGSIEAFGLYATVAPANGWVLMVDSYEISATAIPEPSSVLMTGVGVLLAGMFCARKKHEKNGNHA